jgi:transposase
MPYRIAAIDVHKMVLMVVVATGAEEVKDPTGEALEFECRRFGTLDSDRLELAEWLKERQVQEVVMESTAQYWRPVWMALEGQFSKLNLAQAQSNRAPRGRKDDFRDAKRLARRLLADELMLSFVPPARAAHVAHSVAQQRPLRERARGSAEPGGKPARRDAD